MLQKSKNPFSVYSKVADIPVASWNDIVGDRNVFLSLAYLKALETSLSPDISLRFVLINAEDNSPLVAGIFQIATFTYKKGSQTNLLLKLFQDCKNNDDSVSINGLICGNIFATGAHGFAHSTTITYQSACELMAATAKNIQKNTEYDDLFSVVLFKDYDPILAPKTKVLDDFKYRSFQADVAMVLPIHASWTNFDAYLQSMKAKYRTKANSAYKKSEALTIQSLTASEIEHHETRLQILFDNVLHKSDYRYGAHYPTSFKALKAALGDQFICKGAFLNDQLVGFSTAFLTNGSLDASYVGIDYTLNAEHAIYERLLYDYVEEAILAGVQQLHLGRTSELIKSALGAVPIDMTLYVKHRSKLKNALLKPIVENISPSEYNLRSPFKSKFYTT